MRPNEKTIQCCMTSKYFAFVYPTAVLEHPRHPNGKNEAFEASPRASSPPHWSQPCSGCQKFKPCFPVLPLCLPSSPGMGSKEHRRCPPALPVPTAAWGTGAKPSLQPQPLGGRNTKAQHSRCLCNSHDMLHPPRSIWGKTNTLANL